MSQDEDEELTYENKHLIDLTDANEPSEDQYLESLKETNLTDEEESKEEG